MDNSGDGPLLVPGFNGIPIDEELPVSKRFAHGFEEWKQVPAITVREFTITSVINTLTDKPNWYTDVFQPEVVCRWYNELILSTPLLSEKTWDWCIAELKDKAQQYEAKGFIHVLDTGSCVCKSDRSELQGLSAELQAGFRPLHQEIHPGTSASSVHTYVDPSRYPLVYGKTHILARGGHVSRDGTISSEQDPATEQASAPKNEHVDVDGVQKRIEAGVKGHEAWSYAFNDIGWQNVQKYYWSYKYQCLPSEVAFTGASGIDVHLTSPVNGIHPDNDELHTSLEKLISILIEPWNDCLIQGQDGWKDRSIKVNEGWSPPNNERNQRGRVPCRIITYGVEWENEAPEWFKVFDAGRRKRIEFYQKALAIIEDIKKEQPPKGSDKRTRIKYKLRLKQAEYHASGWEDVKGVEQLPEPTPELWQRAIDYLVQAEPGLNRPAILPEGWQDDVYRLLLEKLSRMLYCKHPEPGTAFTYEEWRDGLHGGKAIVDIVTDRPIIPDKIPPFTPHQPYDVHLQHTFREKGFQVIIRVEGIELTPDNPEYPGDVWELKGQKNEHIVAVGMYTYDVENITESSIAFRQETDVAPGFFRHGPVLFQASSGYSAYKDPAHEEGKGSQMEAISEIFGFDPYQMCGDHRDYALPFQEVGELALRQGRMAAFPNTMESRRKPFRLQDSTKSGHHRWVIVMLVDPNYRICSLRNVPPQQPGWQGDASNASEQLSKEDAERVKKEIAEEHRRMHYARYAIIGTFFFC